MVCSLPGRLRLGNRNRILLRRLVHRPADLRSPDRCRREMAVRRYGLGRDLVSCPVGAGASGDGREPVAGPSAAARRGMHVHGPVGRRRLVSARVVYSSPASASNGRSRLATWIELTYAHRPAGEFYRAAARWRPDWHGNDRRARLAGGSSGLEPGATQAAIHLRSGFAGPGSGPPTAGLSAMIIRAEASVRPRAGRAGIPTAFPSSGAVLAAAEGPFDRDPEETDSRTSLDAGGRRPSAQPPPLPSVRPVSLRSRWRPGRSMLRSLPAAVGTRPPLVPVAVTRPSARIALLRRTLSVPCGNRSARLPASPRDPDPDSAGECSTPGRPDLAVAISLPGPPALHAPRHTASAAAATTRRGEGRVGCSSAGPWGSHFQGNYIIIFIQIRVQVNL